MKQRADSLARIKRLQAQMRDLGQWRLAAIERERMSLGDDLNGVFEALDAADPGLSAYAVFGARRARALQTRLDSLERDSERLGREALAHGLRARLAERAAEAAAKAHREQKARKDLADLIERALARRDASQR